MKPDDTGEFIFATAALMTGGLLTASIFANVAHVVAVADAPREAP